MDNQSMPVSEWILKGSCRRDPNNLSELTPWQNGRDAFKFLPLKPGEKLVQEGLDDGEGGHWVTHRPFPNIRRFKGSSQEFINKFEEQLQFEIDALREDQEFELMQELWGSFVHKNCKQVIWQGCAHHQFADKIPEFEWGRRRSRIKRRPQVIFLVRQQKIIVESWDKTVTETLVGVLKPDRAIWTEPDDVAIMPMYEVRHMK